MPFSLGFRGLVPLGPMKPHGIGSDSSPMFAGLSRAQGPLQRRYVEIARFYAFQESSC
jgi:hypothetical protein